MSFIDRFAPLTEAMPSRTGAVTVQPFSSSSFGSCLRDMRKEYKAAKHQELADRAKEPAAAACVPLLQGVPNSRANR